jgi:hypothetical protein
MSDDQITYLIVGAAGLVSVLAWVVFIAVPAWRSYWRLRERLLAVFMSIYVLAAFVVAGAGVGGIVLWYYDRI